MGKRSYIILIILANFYLSTIAQDNCNFEQTIMNFLQKISSPYYRSALCDFNMFFDNDSEFEIILRNDSIKRNPNLKLTLEDDSKSFVIERILKNETIRHLIDLKTSKNKKWIILKSYPKGSATIVYEIGVETSKYYFKIQLANWYEAMKCKIVDVLDSNDRSIIYNLN